MSLAIAVARGPSGGSWRGRWAAPTIALLAVAATVGTNVGIIRQVGANVPDLSRRLRLTLKELEARLQQRGEPIEIKPAPGATPKPRAPLAITPPAASARRPGL